MTVSLIESTAAVAVAAIPAGIPAAEDFRLVEAPVARPGDGEVLVRIEVLSLDPYLRSLLTAGHLDDPPVGPGDVMPGRSVGVVIESGSPGLPVGARVLAETGWRAHAVVAADQARPVSVPDGVSPSAALGVLGMPGLTAYAAVERHLRPRPGETVVISSATGGVGALAGQLSKLAGARTVAIVGSDDKAELALELGYEVAVVRGRDGWLDALRAACPDRIDAYLHMGDQETLDGVVEQLAIGARVSLTGLIDQSNGAAPTRIRAGALMAARATTYGMVVYDHADLAAEHVERVGRLLVEGTVTAPEDRYDGLEQAGTAFAHLMSGRNRGKVVVTVTHTPS
ncbi:MDR family NADP-dependent oxidoreductase [Aeromicrobium wangtongii]|uniref:NADP-dependent oxidoreductase n=1 Tax=Aeromicrobium wangtongii TaxID=2969247 RepID=A0ABY5M6D8_9ACTN|nr:NADP-dependent oxidoreductase [Aeromicrobium wangtongii]MCD9198599.1 NADP-dependent oxidoreductase [Aeromicrobium wangtongii]UUP12624.1 NADP-dependent oxidoreductase [Aeromicrobium wangtongii]